MPIMPLMSDFNHAAFICRECALNADDKTTLETVTHAYMKGLRIEQDQLEEARSIMKRYVTVPIGR